MDSNISVEAGADDPVIVVPWLDPSGRLRYVEAREAEDWVDEIVEAREWPEVRQTLLAIHAARRGIYTVKCDAWVLSEEERQLDFGPVAYGVGAYFDVLSCVRMGTLAEMRGLVEGWSQELRGSNIEAGCDFVIRPAWVRGEAGYGVTVYVFGYGETEVQARANWAAAMREMAALPDDGGRYNGSAGE